MKKMILIAGFFVLAACEQEKNYLIANPKIEDEQLRVAVRYFDMPFDSPEVQLLVAKSISEIATKIKTKEIIIPENIATLNLRLNSYDSVEFAAKADENHFKWHANYGVSLKDILALPATARPIEYLNKANAIMFGKAEGADKSAKAFCDIVENRKAASQFCGAVDYPTPRHRYDSRDGKYYLYKGEISEEAKKKGVGAGQTLAFEYLGQKDGEQKLKVENGDTFLCSIPCESIKHIWNGKVVERINFDTNSVIGAAFLDAGNGELEVYKPPAKK